MTALAATALGLVAEPAFPEPVVAIATAKFEESAINRACFTYS
jgi:hypothetical protein